MTSAWTATGGAAVRRVAVPQCRLRGHARPVAVKVPSAAGSSPWGGAAGTGFWVLGGPAAELTALFFAQVLADGTLPIRPQLRKLVYQALVD